MVDHGALLHVLIDPKHIPDVLASRRRVLGPPQHVLEDDETEKAEVEGGGAQRLLGLQPEECEPTEHSHHGRLVQGLEPLCRAKEEVL